MKKLILVVVSMLCMCLCFACYETSTNSTSESDTESVVAHSFVKHEAVDPDCENGGNAEYYTCTHCEEIFDVDKNVIDQIPAISANGHSYKLNGEVVGSCTSKGAEAHYECTTCHKLFDLLKNEIDSVDGEYDYANHSGEALIVITSNPVKLTYTVGDSFDPTGLAVAYKCTDCDGEAIDISRLTFEYQTAGATAFAADDTMVIVKYEDFTLEIDVTVENKAVEITGVLDAYTTRCGTAPVIEAVSNIPSLEIFVDYYDADGAIVTPAEFMAGNVYTAVVYVEGAEGIDGAEVETTIYVEHSHLWASDSENANKIVCICECGNEKDFYLLDNQEYYVDEEDMSIDLSKLVFGTMDYSVAKIQQVKNGEKVDITGTNDGYVYTFDFDNYETFSPDKLTLLVTFEVEGREITISLISWCVDKVIRTAEDLSILAYTGGTMTDNGGFATYGYYVLGCDIDATGFVMDQATPAFQAAIGFMGTFDGCGYTISNLNVPYGTKGLFGAIGFGGTVKNVNFENVIVPVKVTEDGGSYLLAFAIRNATLSNVSIEFSHDSLGFKVAREINNTVLDNVSVYTLADHDASFVMSGCDGEFDYTYMPSHTVTFNAAGGSDVASATVVAGKSVSKPSDPTKTLDGYDCAFLGWYLGEEKYDFNKAVTSDITLVAMWQDPILIKEASDLLKLAYTGAASKGDGAFAIGGTYILANDIDATGLVLSGAGPAWQAVIGFCGMFEGQGYTISNLTIPAGSHGLFGAIGLGAVIQNVNFENVTQVEDRHVLAFAIRNATLSNVTVEFSKSSKGFKLAHEINDTIISNVTVSALEGNEAATAFNSCDGEVSYDYWSDKIYIRNAEDLLLLAYTGASDKGEEGAYANSGKYVLANDIDATGLVLVGARPAWQAVIGFTGTFDGQGYTISNLTVPAWSHGLFGAIGYGATITDVNFENLTQGEDGVLFAHAIRNATLSNVTVEFSADSVSYRIANEINDSVIDNVTVITRDGMEAAGTIARCEGEITYEYLVGKIIIRNAEDLLKLAYTGAMSSGEEGSFAMTDTYVLANDIDATGLVLNGTNPAWQAAIGFLGTLDGQGYTISNLTVTNSYGLFGAIGYGAVITDVNFENLVVADGAVLFAHAIRNATLSNVTVEFSADSVSYRIANEINDSVIDNVIVISAPGQVAAGKVSNCDGEIAYEYFGMEEVDAVIAQIANLPDSVTMPDHTFFVTRISTVVNAYNALNQGQKDQVTNYAKLEALIANISGYETISSPSLENASVIPSYVPNYTSSVGGTASVREDNLYGNVFTATSDANGVAAIVFSNFPDVSKYETIYVWVRVVGDSCNFYFSDGTTNDGWGNNWNNSWSIDGMWANNGNWICKAIDVSTGIFASEWALGVRSRENGVVIEVADIVGKVKPAAPDAATGLTFGNFADSGETNEHGTIYNFTQGWSSSGCLGAFNQNRLSGALVSGHNAIRFWIYNPNSVDVEMYFENAAEVTVGEKTTLKAGEWTEVVISPEIIAWGEEGVVYINVTSGYARTEGWKISSLYSTYAA